MYAIKELCKELSLTYTQLRHRLTLLGKVLEPYIHRGNKNEILVDIDGLQILRRLRQIEVENQLGTKEAVDYIKEELEIQGRSTKEDISSDNKDQLIAELKTRIHLLDAMVEDLRKDKQRLYEIIYNRLPPSQEEIKQKLEQKASRWLRFKQLLKGE